MMDEKRFTLRLDNDVFDGVAKLADTNKRSVAKEIEYILDLYISYMSSADDYETQVMQDNKRTYNRKLWSQDNR